MAFSENNVLTSRGGAAALQEFQRQAFPEYVSLGAVLRAIIPIFRNGHLPNLVQDILLQAYAGREICDTLLGRADAFRWQHSNIDSVVTDAGISEVAGSETININGDCSRSTRPISHTLLEIGRRVSRHARRASVRLSVRRPSVVVLFVLLFLAGFWVLQSAGSVWSGWRCAVSQGPPLQGFLGVG